MKRSMLIMVMAMLAGAAANADDWDRRQAMNAITPHDYLCYQAGGEVTIDGRLDDAAWQNAPWTEFFQDIEGEKKPLPLQDTRAKMLWDDQYFYVGAWLEEQHVWGTLTKRDSVIFYDNDFEIFIDPDGDTHEYFEIEINALNTVWDLFLAKPYKDGGPPDNSWDIEGLKTAVHVAGTLNDYRDIDRYWSVEFAIPWDAFPLRDPDVEPPQDGDQWRVNFSRVQWQHVIEERRYQKVPNTPEFNWVWSPQGIIDMHRPEKWPIVQFTTAQPGRGEFRPDQTQPARQVLFDLYYQQRDHRRAHGQWAEAIDSLDLRYDQDAFAAGPVINATTGGYQAWVTLPTNEGLKKVTIRHDALLKVQAAEE